MIALQYLFGRFCSMNVWFALIKRSNYCPGYLVRGGVRDPIKAALPAIARNLCQSLYLYSLKITLRDLPPLQANKDFKESFFVVCLL